MNLLTIINLIANLIAVIDESKIGHSFKTGRLLMDEANTILDSLKKQHEEQQNKESSNAVA